MQTSKKLTCMLNALLSGVRVEVDIVPHEE